MRCGSALSSTTLVMKIMGNKSQGSQVRFASIEAHTDAGQRKWRTPSPKGKVNQRSKLIR